MLDRRENREDLWNRILGKMNLQGETNESFSGR